MKKIITRIFLIITILTMASGITRVTAYGANYNNIARVTNVKITVKSNKVVIKWKKVKNAKGYQIKISINKKFKKSNTRTFNKKSSKLDIKLDNNKTYYIKIRAYKKINETKKYGKWSKKKNFTLKKKVTATGYWCYEGGTHHSFSNNAIGWYNTAKEAEERAYEYIIKNGGSANYLIEQCDFCNKWSAEITLH